MCDVNLYHYQLMITRVGVDVGRGTPIESAAIVELWGGTCDVNIVSFDRTRHISRWYSGTVYDPTRTITQNTFMHSDGITIVSIPYSLLEFFSMKPYAGSVYRLMLKRVNGYEHVMQFKRKMMLAIVGLMWLVPRELAEYIVVTACHSYKDHDYVTYLELMCF